MWRQGYGAWQWLWRYQFTRVFKAKRLDARARQRGQDRWRRGGQGAVGAIYAAICKRQGTADKGIYTQPGIKRAGQANVQYAVQRADFMKMHFIHAFAVYGCFAFGEQRNTLPGKCFGPVIK